MIDLIFSFLLKNGINTIDKKDFELQLLTHPEQSSFRAISDTLDYFDVENIVVNVPEDSLNQLPNNFLTLYDDNNQLILVSKKKNRIVINKANGRSYNLNSSEFKSKWNKTIIAVEETKTKQYSFFKKHYFTIPLFLILVYLLSAKLTLENYFFLTFSSLGVYVSHLLIKEKMGFTSVFVQKLCTKTTNSSCNDVINSKGGLLFNKIDLADASFITFISVAFMSIYGNSTLAYLLSIATVPILLYSIFYQAFVLKKWCALCLIVVGLFMSMATISYIIISQKLQRITFVDFFEFFAIIASIITLYIYTKTLITENKKARQETINAVRIKRDPFILKMLMENSDSVTDNIPFENEVVLGNLKSTKNIIALTNPFCGHCKSAFENYLKAVKVNRDLKIVFRFSIPDDFESTASKITIRLVEIYLGNGERKFIESYSDWFKNKDKKNWFSKYGSPNHEPYVINLLKKQKAWVQKMEINYTPTTIIGNTFYPNKLGYNDLPFVLDLLFEFEKNTKENKTIIK